MNKKTHMHIAIDTELVRLLDDRMRRKIFKSKTEAIEIGLKLAIYAKELCT